MSASASSAGTRNGSSSNRSCSTPRSRAGSTRSEPEPGFAYWALLGPDVELRRTAYDLEGAIERLRMGGMPGFDKIGELMRTPPPQAEVIEHAERVVFAG